MKKRILFLHTVPNTPYKHVYFNSLSSEYDVFVIELAKFSSNRNWEEIENKKYSEYVLFNGEIGNRNKFSNCLKAITLTKKIKPHIIISNGYFKVEFLLIPFVFRSSITACDLASSFNDKQRNAFKESVKRYVINWLFKYFFTYGKSSKKYLTDHLKIPAERIFIRGNYSKLQEIELELPVLEKRAKRILYVGRFSREKNIEGLIKNFIEYKKNSSEPYELYLIGSGNLESDLKKLATESNFSKSIHFIQSVQQNELVKYYINARLFILPSFSEPWGQVINEAMHFGLPIVISKYCGCAEDLCSIENAVVFDPMKMDDLTTILNSLLPNESKLKSMGQASLQNMKSFSPNHLHKQQLEIFEQVLSITNFE